VIITKAFLTPHRQLEQACLLALLSDPTLLNYIDRAFRSFELACIHVDDFSDTDHREIFKLLKESIDQEAEEPLNFIHERLSAEMKEAFTENTPEETYPDWRLQPTDPKLEALVRTFIRLRRVRIDEGLDQLVFLQTQERDESGEFSIDVKKTALEYIQVRAKLDHALQQSFARAK
jgi:hypothetical protein